MKNIVLIGLMGSGKTVVSKKLEQKLNKPRYSTDEAIELQEGLSIAQIVDKKGWSYFRTLEHELIKNLAQKKDIIIDCGGGVVLNPDNLVLLKKNGMVFFLKASPEILYRRLKNDKTRPLINGPDPQARLKELYEERLPLYNQADVIVDASDDSCRSAIVEILKKVS